MASEQKPYRLSTRPNFVCIREWNEKKAMERVVQKTLSQLYIYITVYSNSEPIVIRVIVLFKYNESDITLSANL